MFASIIQLFDALEEVIKDKYCSDKLGQVVVVRNLPVWLVFEVVFRVLAVVLHPWDAVGQTVHKFSGEPTTE